jgi:hypothetical protein
VTNDSAAYGRLADPSDIGRLISGDNVIWDFPPPGTHEQLLAFPEPWTILWGDPTVGDADTWFVTTLAHATGLDGAGLAAWAASRLGLFTGPVAAFASSVGNWPIIYEMNGARLMRWIKITHRGNLGTTEQFQWQTCFGNPGDDPDISAAQAATLALDCLDFFKAAFEAGGALSMQSRHHAEVVYTEIGVVQEELNTPTNADGSGGDLSQTFPTEFAAYATVDRPTGNNVSKCLPYEVACALTLQTSKRGPSGRGRIYLPPLASNLMDLGGRFIPSIPTALADSIGNYYEAVTLNHGYVPLVVSKRRKVLNEVTEIFAGSIPDSQRRRRRAQDELRLLGWTKP